jgi:hypothetical protein
MREKKRNDMHHRFRQQAAMRLKSAPLLPGLNLFVLATLILAALILTTGTHLALMLAALSISP